MLSALKAKEKIVFYEACRCCSWNKLKQAVTPLMALAKRNDDRKDAERAKVIFLALGNIGDLRALSVVCDSPWTRTRYQGRSLGGRLVAMASYHSWVS